jgi:hypothetical protein
MSSSNELQIVSVPYEEKANKPIYLTTTKEIFNTNSINDKNIISDQITQLKEEITELKSLLKDLMKAFQKEVKVSKDNHKTLLELSVSINEKLEEFESS